MNRVLKIALACFASNMLFIALFISWKDTEAFVEVGLLWIFYLVVQLITGFILSFNSSRKDFGKGILLGAAVGMVIGFSVCSGVVR